MKSCTSVKMLSVRFLLFVFIWIIGACIGEEIQLVLEPTYQNVTAGGNVTLSCVWDAPIKTCIWMKDDEIVNSEGKSRYAFVNSAENCTLTITRVQIVDEGKWMCGFSNRISQTFKNVFLSVNKEADSAEFPKRAIVVHPQDQNVTIESTTVLRCEFSNPLQRCFWAKNGDIVTVIRRYSFTGNVTEGNCSIKITNVQPFDDGVWQCGYPRTDADMLLTSEKANLSVIIMPSDPVIVVNGMKIKNGDKLYLVGSLQYLSISCWSENGSPAAKLQWGFKTESTTYHPLDGSYYDYEHQSQIHENVNSKVLKISSNKLRTDHVNSGWNQYYLICTAFHPTYVENVYTNVQLIVSKINNHYYG